MLRAAGFEIRVAHGEPDPQTDALFERALRRTPAQRLADATNAARFVNTIMAERPSGPSG